MSFELRKLEDVCDILDHMRIPITSRDRKEGPYPYYGANGIQDYIDDFIFDDELVLLAEDGGNFGSKEKPIAYRISGKTWVNNHAHVLKPKNIIDIDYLCYSLMYYDVSGLVNGATRQKLTQSEMRKINIRYRSLEKQRQMVFKIKLISNIISSREHQLSNLNLLVKSRFIEMFGEPIKNSKGLPLIRLGDYCYLKAGVTTPADTIHEYSKEYNVPCYGGNGIRGYVKEATQSGEYPIIGRQGALCGNVKLATGIFHATEHAVLVKALKPANTVWLYFMLMFMDLYRFHTGAAQPGLAVKTLNTILVPEADVNLQNQFADFVAQVDKSKFVVTAKFQ